MPDISELIGQHTQDPEENSTQASSVDPMEQQKDERNQEVQKKELNFKEVNSGGRVLNEQERRNEASNRVATNQNPITSELSGDPVAEEGSVGADKTVNNFLYELGSNVVAGFGSEVVGSTGSIVNMIGAGLGVNSMYEGNWIGKQLVDAGESISSEYGTRVPDELMDPNLTLQNFLDPQAWSTVYAKYIPQLAEFILLSKGAGSLARGGANALGKNAVKNLTKKGTTKFGRTTLKNTTKSVTDGVKEGVDELNGGGWLRSFMKDTGELTASGAVGAETIGAGAGGNIFSGLMNSAQAYQEKASLTDENGNPLYSEEELGNVAAETFKRNLYYMPVDILSWGMTFGNGAKMVKNLGGKGMQSTIKKINDIKGTIGEPFAKISKSNFAGLARVTKTALAEGFEESIQETYESWSAMRAQEDALGIPSKYGDDSITNFMDFYESKENEGTIFVSAGLGAMGGAFSKIRGGINEQAERERQLYNRTENLKTMFADGDVEGIQRQKQFTLEMVSDAVLNDKVEQVKPILQSMAEKGQFSEEEAAYYESLFEDYAELDRVAKTLNVRGRVALFKNHTMQSYLEGHLEELKAEMEDAIETTNSADDQVLTPAQKARSIERSQKNYENQAAGIIAGIAQAATNKGNLLVGDAVENAVNVDFKNVNGKAVAIVGLDKGDFQRFVADKDADILAGKRSVADGPIAKAKKSIEKNDITGKAKKMYNSMMEEVKSFVVGEDESIEMNEKTDTALAEEEGDINAAEAEASVGKDEYNNPDNQDDSTEKPNNSTEKPNNSTPKPKTGKPLSSDEETEMDELKQQETAIKADIDKRKADMRNLYNGTKDPKFSPEQVAAMEKGIADRAKANAAGEAVLKENEARLKELSERALNSADNKIEDEKLDPLAGNTVRKAKLTDNKINPELAKKLATKLANKARLTAKESKLYDKFKDTIDKISESLSDKGKQFTDYVRSQEFDNRVARNKKAANDTLDEATDNIKKNVESFVNSPAGKALKKKYETVKTVFKKTNDDIFAGRESRASIYDNIDEGTIDMNETTDMNENDNGVPRIGKETGTDVIINDDAIDSMEFTPNPMDYITPIGPLRSGPTEVAIMIGANERMKSVFPNMKQRPRIIVMENLRKALGIEGVGYSIGAMVYVQRDKWNQGETYMHEMMHVFYKFGKNEPQTLNIIKEALKNKVLLNKVLRKYPDEILYKFTDPETGEVQENVYLNPEHHKKNEKELKELGVEIMPITSQDVILEELFAAYMQGPMNEKYNQYFAPRNEFSRQRGAAKWWNSLKDKVDAAEMEADNQEYLKKLSNGEPFNTNNMRDYVVQKFNDAIGKIDGAQIGFEQRLQEYQAVDNEKKVEIIKDLTDQIENFKESVFKAKQEVWEDTRLDELSDLEMTEEVTEGNDNPVLSILDKTFQAKAGEATKILNQFIKDYNKAVRLRSMYGIKAPQFDRRDFKYRIFEFARYSPDTPTFIKLLEDSNEPSIVAFTEYLSINASGQDKVLLNGIRTVMGNFKMVNAMHNSLVMVNGKLEIQSNESLSTTENSRVQNMAEQMKQARDHYNNKTGHMAAKQFKEFMNSLERIKQNDDMSNINDYVYAWKFISNGGQIKLSEILNFGYVNYQGVAYNPMTLLKNFVDNNRHTGNSTYYSKKDKKAVDSKTPDPYKFSPLFKILASTNRAFTQDSLVQNAKNNAVPVRITNNNMSKELDQINDFLKPNKNGNYPSKDAFLKRFGHASIRKNKNSSGNEWLNFYYDSVVNKDQIPDMVYYTGIDDRVTNKGKTYDESTAYEQSLEDFMFFTQAKGKLTYLQNMGVLGDSPRKFYMPAKKMIYANNFKGGKISGDSRSVRAAYNVLKNTDNPDMSYEQFVDKLNSDINDELKFIEGNSVNLKKIKQLKDYFDASGKLSSEGVKAVQEYALSNALNGYFMAEVFAPGITTGNIEKRLKNSSSPVYSVNKKLKFEMVAYKDEADNLNNIATDGGMYILEKHAKKWQAAGLGVMDLNHGFKFLNYSIEKDNPNFKGKTVLLKGYTTVLTEDELKKNPKLRGLAKVLEDRDKKYEEYHLNKHGGLPTDVFSDGMPNSFPIAIPASAIKTGVENSSELPSLSGMNRPKGRAAANTYQDKQNYSEKGDYYGLSGYNFGPQQVMDKQTYSVTLPVQQINSLMVYSGRNPEALAKAEGVQAMYSNEMKKNLDSILRKVKNGEGMEGYKQFLMDNLDLDAMDPVQAMVIRKYGVAHLRAHQVVINTLANKLKVAGNKLKLPGSYSHQKSDWGYELPQDVYVNGTNSLQGYSDNADGTTRRAEIVLPRHLQHSKENGQIKARKYFTVNNASLKLNTDETLQALGRSAADYSKIVNRPVEIAYDKKGVQIGFYVSGDTVMATRVPSNGPNFTGVFEVVDFGATEGNQVQVPAEFSSIIGADLDGDALFIQTQGKNANLNKALEAMAELWTSKEMRTAITNRMETKKDAKALAAKIEKKFESDMKENLPFTPAARRNSYQNSMIASRNIGTVFNLHRVANTLAAYDTKISRPISVDGTTYDGFMDTSDGTTSRNHQSALVANMILDNLTLDHLVEKLNINEHTVSAFTLLVNMGVSIEKTATLMNAPLVKEYVSMMNENNSAYHGYTKKADMLKALSSKSVKGPNGTKISYTKNGSGAVTTDMKNDAFYTAANQSGIIDLLQEMDVLNGEVQSISRIMAGHKGIETNPHLLEKHLKDFNTIMNNEKSYNEKEFQLLQVDSRMKNNPDIARYKYTAEQTLEQTKSMDYVYRPAVTQLFNRLGDVTSQDGLTGNQIKKYSQTVQQFLNSRLLGSNTLSQEYYKQLIDYTNENSVFRKLQDHISELAGENKLSGNMLLTQALNITLSPNTQIISMNKSFFDDSITTPEFDKVSREFADLPADLQQDLFNYDLLRNRWDGTYSILPIMGVEFNSELLERQKDDYATQNTKQYKPSTINQLERVIMAKDFHSPRNNFKSVRLPLEKSKQGKEFKKALRDNNFFAKKMAANEPFYFVSYKKAVVDGKITTERKLVYFKGVSTPNTENNFNNKVSSNIDIAIRTKAFDEVDTSGDLDIKLITIKDDNFKGFNPSKKKAVSVTSPVKPIGSTEGRQAKEEYWRYNNIQPLTQTEFDQAMEYGPNVSSAQRQARYDEYYDAKNDANIDYQENFENIDIESQADEWVLENYEKYAAKPAYAYSIITKPLVIEMARRASARQTKITGRVADGKDINAMNTYLMADNVPSNHPAVQAMVREIKAEHKRFIDEKKKYAERINKATDKLYMEKFGFNIKNKTPWNLIKRIYYTFLYNRKNLYDNLYGNIVNRETIVRDGRSVESFRLKTNDEIESLKANNSITAAEYEFYQMFKGVTNELAPFSSNQGKLRKNYIPHVNMSIFESFANRGLLGLMANSRSGDEKIADVKMYMNNPINGQKELWRFSDIRNHYRAMAVKKGNKLSTIKEYVILERKAQGLLKNAKNEDKTDLVHDAQAMDSALDFGMMNRFSHSRSVSAAEMPSMDLNHALMTYTHATLFTNGNSNFKGFKKLQGLVDGIIANNENSNLGNINKYIKINWKDAYLRGKKQVLFNKPVDSVIDFMTKMNLFYQLGGKVTYVVGNVISGKYHNIKNNGGTAWAKGEKRFWGLDNIKNPLDIPKRMRRAHRILKNLNYMDINIYDNVSFQSSNRLDNFFGDLALMPMAWSEKWIQSVQFLGLLTDEEMQQFDDNGDFINGVVHISPERVSQLENEVTKSQGKGYQMIDQRGIQQYSLGRMFMQFSRFIPTMFYDNFGKEDIDIYGKKNIGSLRAVYSTVMKVQSLNPRDYMRYMKKLERTDPALKERIEAGLRGLAMSSVIGAYATSTDNELAKGAFWDANYFADIDKLIYKMVPSAVRSTDNLVSSLFK